MAIPSAPLAEHEVAVYVWARGLILCGCFQIRMNLDITEKNKVVFWLSVPA